MPSHDQLFKQLLRKFFGDFLEIVIPELAEKLRPEEARASDKELFTDSPEGEGRVVDLLLEVPAKRGRPRTVLIHVEIEAEARAKMARRLLEYALTIRLEHDPPIIPIVVYIRGGKPDVVEEVYREELWGRDLLSFTYWTFSLSPSEAKKYLARPEPVAWALAAMMTPGGLGGRPGLKLASLERIAAGEVDEAQRSVLVNFVKTELQLTEEEEMAYQEALATEEHRELAEFEMTWADRIRAEGLEQGLEQGRTALQGTILRILSRRFGEVPAGLVEAVRGVEDTEVLGQLAEQAATVKSLDDFRAAI